MHSKRHLLIAATLGMSVAAVAGTTIPVIGTLSPAQAKPIVAKPVAKPANKPLPQAAMVQVARPQQNAAVRLPPMPLPGAGIEEAKKMAELSRLNAVAEAQVKLLENQKKIAELQRNISSGGSQPPAGNTSYGSGAMMPGLTGGAVSVVSVMGFDGKSYAEIATDAGISRYKVGDIVPSAGKVRSIRVDGVTLCRGSRCRHVPVSSSTGSVMTQPTTMAAGASMPPQIPQQFPVGGTQR